MIGIAGGGAFGTALGIALAGAGREVRLWARDPSHVTAMTQSRENRRHLPGHALPPGLSPVADVAALSGAKAILLAVPMQALRGLVEAEAETLAPHRLVACCKGVELGTTLGPAEVLAKALPGASAAILTGPSFAHDIARGLPTALTLACADEAAGEALQALLSTPVLRLYRTADIVGAELGGALKNVIAIACGAAIGAGLGESARAAVMTRGFAEMNRMAVAQGADPATLAGLSGFGDLALTCTSEGSRNYRRGLALGRGDAFDPAVTVEGAATARAVAQRAARLGVEMPITEAVVALLEGRLDVTQAMDMLLARPLRAE
ncbi:NAD(P)H-dependent glycerol-3-phosphate dehydrogenase [Rhodosalinus sp. 5P4]|uniref:NAD(P)H-dependent glycerol-3-phosphate dehydrogenase n=1 Tax=Rhodosalinus sp. 5P4 TaxID=3239196 RepID=UPI0035255E67